MSEAASNVTIANAGGEYMDNATVIEWVVADGSTVAEGDTLVIVETAKASIEIVAGAAGVLTCLAQVGDEVGRTSVIATIAARDALPPATSAPEREASDGEARETPRRRLPTAFASPLAKRLALNNNVDLDHIVGTGPRDRIVGRDVRAAIEAATSGKTQPTVKAAQDVPSRPAERPVQRAATSGSDIYRRAMAGAMASVVDIPMFSVTKRCEMARLREQRRHAKTLGASLSLNDLFLFVVARTLRDHPRLNARWQDDGAQQFDRVGLAFAISTPRGLVAPTIHDADRLTLAEIARASRELQARAAEGRLSSADLSGATFSVSNLGPFGITSFVPVVTPPQCAILGIASSETIAHFDGSRLEAREFASLTVSADHRAIDGADAARFLADLADRIGKVETGDLASEFVHA